MRAKTAFEIKRAKEKEKKAQRKPTGGRKAAQKKTTAKKKAARKSSAAKKAAKKKTTSDIDAIRERMEGPRRARDRKMEREANEARARMLRL